MRQNLFKAPFLGFLLVAGLLLGACNTPAPVQTSLVEEPSPTPTAEVILPTWTPQPFPTPPPEEYPPPALEEAYPGPEIAAPSPEIEEDPLDAYPPPESQADPGLSAYPPPEGEGALPTSQAYPPPQATLQAAPTLASTPSFPPTAAAPLLTPGVTPIERLARPAMPPPGPGVKTVTLWHAWNEPQAQVLEEVLAAFQQLYPDVYFDVLYVPFDDLLMTFQASAFRTRGPSLLLGPAEWGPELYDAGLVVSVDDLAIPAFLDRINPAALDSARYRGTLISLPHSIREGVVMYRNRQIIPTAPATFAELVSAAKDATSGGRVGAYLERGFYYSAGHLYGSGGRLLDENGDPAFNNQKGVDWLNLLLEFEQAGATSLNTNRDLDLFKAGRVGIIIDGTWNRQSLESAIGEVNLTIDPWPTYKDGRLSGFIKSDNIYLTSRATDDERYAALQFIGFMLAPEVQAVLTRANHIPALTNVEVGLEWMQQAMLAFEGAAPFPTHPYYRLYWDPLETAMGSVFSRTMLPERALRQASDSIRTRIREIQANP
jgi:arabinogalactan oligomer / maltooligosaccharide transport system substrate-binding protein